jgi:hypothetical protein
VRRKESSTKPHRGACTFAVVLALVVAATPASAAWFLNCGEEAGFGPFSTATECSATNGYAETRCQYDTFTHETAKSLARWKAICRRLKTADCVCQPYYPDAN